jgi:hypothetical protein
MVDQLLSHSLFRTLAAQSKTQEHAFNDLYLKLKDGQGEFEGAPDLNK